MAAALSFRQIVAILAGLALWVFLYQVSQGATNRDFLLPNNPPFYVLLFAISTFVVYLTDRGKIFIPLVTALLLWTGLGVAFLLGYGYLFGLTWLVIIVGLPLSLGLAWAAGYIMEKMPIF